MTMTLHLLSSLPLTHHNCVHIAHYEIANDFDFTSVFMSFLLFTLFTFIHKIFLLFIQSAIRCDDALNKFVWCDTYENSPELRGNEVVI